MKTTVRFVAMFLVLITACNRDDEDFLTEESANSLTPLTPYEINAQIHSAIAESGSFDWKDASDHLLWSAIVHGQGLVSVGYGTTSFSEENTKKRSNLQDYIVNLVRESEQIYSKKKKKDLRHYSHEAVNVLDVTAWSLETVVELRNDKNVRYVEPIGYRFFDYEPAKKSDSGCDKDSHSIHPSDYRLIPPNCYVSWVSDYHKVPQAWDYATGAGVGVGVIDTGLSPEQYLLNDGINDGASEGRYVRKYGTYVNSYWPWATETDGPNDKCGHGNSMAANLASPRNNDYLPVGVAYNCNLISYRGTYDVILNGGHEQTGVANALIALAKRSDVKIITMSVGHVFSIGKISDAIKYAYSKGKLIFAAGGTSSSYTSFAGVIFPAWMNEVIAVTGVRDTNTYTACDVCHEGKQIEFTVVVQRASNLRRKIPILGYRTGDVRYEGASSCATSFTAGVAALVWSRYPSWTRGQVYKRLKESADLYPNRHSQFGYGNINALKAVR